MSATPLTKVYDVSGTLGGPIRKDRLWYFATAHIGGSTRTSPASTTTLNAGDASKWLYTPDYRRPSYSDRTFENASGRVTWQMTPRNKLAMFWDAQRCAGPALARRRDWPSRSGFPPKRWVCSAGRSTSRRRRIPRP